MKLLFKQRYFCLLDNFDIYDEKCRTVYVAEGQLTLGHCLKTYDRQDREVGMVKQKLLTLLPKFEMYLGDQYVGCIEKELTLITPKYHIDYNGWYIEGDWFDWDYSIYCGSREVAKISKEILNWTDTYSIRVHDPADALCALMVVLSIDAEKCSRRK